MVRKPRLHVSGGVYHLMVRGNGGQDIFFETGDRAYLSEVAVYVYRDASTFSRHIGKMDASVQSRKGGLSKLKEYIKALTQA